MLGLAIIFFLFLYAVIWISLTLLTGYLGWRFTKSKKIMLFSGMIGFSAMYWPVFGDLIPTLWAHKQFCEKEAGFKIYVSPEQWAVKNPGVLETLTPYKKYIESEGVVFGNQRIGSDFHRSTLGVPYIQKSIEKIIDVKTREVLAVDVDFSRGYGNFMTSDDNRALKFWLYSGSCYSDVEAEIITKNRIDFFRKLKAGWGESLW